MTIATAPPSTELQFRTVTFTAGGSELGDGEFDGHAAVFNSLDSYFTIFSPGCFANTLAAFRDHGVITWQHNWDQPIGRPIEAREDQTGLYIRAKISDVPQGRDALTLIRDGVITRLSFGFQILSDREMTEEEGIALLGEVQYYKTLSEMPWWTDGLRVIEDVKLYEIAPVSVASNENATITGVRDSSLAGLTLGEHSETALAVVRGWCERMGSFAEMKTREGRVLSEANRMKLASMRDALSEHGTMLDELLAATAPVDQEAERQAAAEIEQLETAKEANRLEARRLYAQYLRQQSIEQGVTFA